MVSNNVKNPSSIVMQTSQDKYIFFNIGRARRKIWPSKAVDRFIRKIGKPNTQSAYLMALEKYFRWLKEHEVNMTPDQLIVDNYLLNSAFRLGTRDYISITGRFLPRLGKGN